MAEAVAIVLDVGPHMNLIPHGKTDSYLDISLDCIQMILQRKMFAESKDEVALVLFGTDHTANDLAAEGGGYDHITVAQPLAKVGWPMLEFVQAEMKTSSKTADFMDALVVACDHLMRASTAGTKKKKFESKSIVLFSNLHAPFGDDQAEEIISGLKNSEIDLTVIGPNLDESGNSQNDDDSESAMYRNQKTPQQKAGELMIKQVLDELDGECYSFDEAIQALSLFQKKSVKQINFKYELETANMKIPVRMCTKISEAKTKTMKKVNAKTSETIVNERTYHIPDEKETEVEKEELINAHRYGNTLVPFSEEDTINMKFTADKCLKVLGFTKNKNIKRHHFTGTSVICVIPEPGDDAASVALSALIHALYELDTAIIVRRVYQNRAAPKLGLMTPHIKVNYHCLLYSELPFAEDLRQYTFGSLPLNDDVPPIVKKIQPSEDQLNVMDELITEMNLCPKNEDDEVEECLKPKLTFNPYRQRLFQCILHRGLNPGVELPELNPIVAEALKIPEEIVKKAEPVQEKMKEMFKLIRVQTKKDEAEVGDGEPAAKKPKIEDVKSEPSGDAAVKTETSSSSQPSSQLKEISSVTPIEDFKAMVSDHSSLEQACKLLQKQITDQILISFGNKSYQKAINCLKVMRNECVTNDKAQIFNDYMQELKNLVNEKKLKDFWKMLGSDSVYLISRSECPSSSVTMAMATSFLDEEDSQENKEMDAFWDDGDDDFLNAL